MFFQDVMVTQRSACYLQSVLRFVRQLEENKVGLRIQVVLPGFVNDSQISLLGCFVVGQNCVNFTLFQIPTFLVLYAKRK
jgi:hypothetical protein